MPDRTPAEIRIGRRPLTVLRRVLMVAQPKEGCALLLGTAASCGSGQSAAAPRVEGPAWEIRLIWPCLNVWQPEEERPRRFLLDPREQLLAQRWGRERDLQVLGSAHSHPSSLAQPSATDLELAVVPALQLILSPLQHWAPACWWLEQHGAERPTARRLQWRMVD